MFSFSSISSVMTFFIDWQGGPLTFHLLKIKPREPVRKRKLLETNFKVFVAKQSVLK